MREATGFGNFPLKTRVRSDFPALAYKLHPFCYLGQASVLCLTHRVFFFRICKVSFNRFFAVLVKRLVLRYILGIVRQILIALPDMPLYRLYTRNSSLMRSIPLPSSDRAAQHGHVGLSHELGLTLSGRSLKRHT